jgi:hypothetical protein
MKATNISKGNNTIVQDNEGTTNFAINNPSCIIQNMIIPIYFIVSFEPLICLYSGFRASPQRFLPSSHSSDLGSQQFYLEAYNILLS